MTEPITPDERAYLRALADDATEGPWVVHGVGSAGDEEPSSIVVHTGKFDYADVTDPEGTSAVVWTPSWEHQEHNNADFIAAARTAVPRLLDALDEAEAEVARLREDAAKAWDEDAVTEAVESVLESDWHGEYTCDCTTDRCPTVPCPTSTPIYATRARDILAVVRKHLPIKPDRETVARAIYAQEAQPIYDEVSERTVGSRPWEWLTEEHRDRYLSRADEIINLWPGESRTEAQAEALYDAADEYEARLPDGTGNGRAYNSYTVAAMLRARADRLKKGADRG